MARAWGLVFVLGCFHSNGVECMDGTVCPPGLECAPDVGGCIDPGACTDVPDGTACGTTGACVNGTCRAPACGNGLVERDEACDDGNLLSHDGCSSRCQAEMLAWTQLAAPSATFCFGNASASYDVMRGRLIAVAERAACGTAELSGATWMATTAYPGTTDRASAPLAYDVSAQVNVIFGGFYVAPKTGNDVFSADTSTWNGAAWTAKNPLTAPAARAAHAMTALPGGGIVLFGGWSATGAYADTWQWDGTTWSAIPTSVAPLPRMRAAMAYDLKRGYALLFGGSGDPGPAYGDTWAWDGTMWRELLAASAALGSRSEGLMIYDPVRGRVVLASGSAVFEWDGTDWQQVATDPTPPAFGSMMAYDALGSRFVSTAYADGSTWQGQWTDPGEVDEACMAGVDADGDGLAGCDDPDCWVRCTPFCPPGAPCDPNAPHCGDGTCNPDLESAVCPADCP